MTPEERERILIAASARYMRGELSLDELQAIKEAHRFDYRAAALALVRSRRLGWQRVLNLFD